MTDARRITVGPIAAAYLEIQRGTVLVPGTDFDALHAEAEALQQKLAAFEELHGGELLKVDTFYPSSQTCSLCGYQNPLTKDLKVREWDCPACGTHHDRDVNAAKNILRKALEDRSTAA